MSVLPLGEVTARRQRRSAAGDGPSNTSVILQICAKVAPLAQAYTTSIRWGLNWLRYVSSSTSSLASAETLAMRLAHSWCTTTGGRWSRLTQLAEQSGEPPWRFQRSSPASVWGARPVAPSVWASRWPDGKKSATSSTREEHRQKKPQIQKVYQFLISALYDVIKGTLPSLRVGARFPNPGAQSALRPTCFDLIQTVKAKSKFQQNISFSSRLQTQG